MELPSEQPARLEARSFVSALARPKVSPRAAVAKRPISGATAGPPQKANLKARLGVGTGAKVPMLRIGRNTVMNTQTALATDPETLRFGYGETEVGQIVVAETG